MFARHDSTHASSVVMWCQQWKISLLCTRGPQRASSFGLVTDLLWCSVFTGGGSAVCLMEKAFEGRHELPFSYAWAAGWGLQKGSENLQQAPHAAFFSFFTGWLIVKLIMSPHITLKHIFHCFLLTALSLSVTFLKFGPSGPINEHVRLLTWQGFLNFGFLWAHCCPWQRRLPTSLCMQVVSRLATAQCQAEDARAAPVCSHVHI